MLAGCAGDQQALENLLQKVAFARQGINTFKSRDRLDYLIGKVYMKMETVYQADLRQSRLHASSNFSISFPKVKSANIKQELFYLDGALYRNSLNRWTRTTNAQIAKDILSFKTNDRYLNSDINQLEQMGIKAQLLGTEQLEKENYYLIEYKMKDPEKVKSLIYDQLDARRSLGQSKMGLRDLVIHKISEFHYSVWISKKNYYPGQIRLVYAFSALDAKGRLQPIRFEMVNSFWDYNLPVEIEPPVELLAAIKGAELKEESGEENKPNEENKPKEDQKSDQPALP
jgi:hypothetical protein